ncbi:hypothetical protein ACJJIF_16845 [Microbulbifer sp. SSSA002]|uniref:hypothetical protein n=1 Tax=Microbulbifer sp. SSSA002 TaxID=3243376 RepID=UPI004039D82B
MKYQLLLWVILQLCVTDTYALNLEERHLWGEDITQLQTLITEKHIDPFANIKEEKFNASVEQLVGRLPGLNEAQVEVEIMRLTRSIGDAHTSYNIMSGAHRHYPLRFKYFGENLKVVDTTKEYHFLLGADLRGINNYSLAQLQQNLSPYINFVDNVYSFRHSFSFHITVNKFLFGAGVSDDLNIATFKFAQGDQPITIDMETISMQQFAELSSDYVISEPEIHYFNFDLVGIRLAYLDNYNTVYVDFDSYPESVQLQQHCESIKDKIRDSGASNLVIDFRNNRGGDFYVGLALSACIQDLDQLDWRKGIFVMMDAGTQSAAMSNAAQYQQILNATLVGSPTGADPNIASETNHFRLKNSNRSISISKRYYGFRQTPSDALYPDLPMTTRWEDYKEGRDGPLLQLLSFIQDKGRSD